MLTSRYIQFAGDDTSSGGGGGGAVSELSVNGMEFIANGVSIKMRAVTAFTIWQDFIAGELGKLSDFVGYFTAKKFNAFRGFGDWGNTGFNPVHNQGNYEKLAELDAWINDRGARLFLTCFTDQVDGSSVLMSKAEQDFHHAQCAEALLKRKTSWREWVNEYRKNWKEPYPIPLSRSVGAGVVSTISTWYDGHDPQEQGQYLDYLTKHLGGFDEEWSRKSKVGHEAQRQGLGPYPAAGKPCVIGEKPRIAEGALPREYADSTALEEMLCSGGCLHGGFGPSRGHDSDLQHCVIPTNPDAIACVDAAASVFDIIDPHTAANGEYRNGPSNGVLEHDDNRTLRTYVMIEGSKATAVRVKGRKAGQPAVAVNDWRITDMRGYEDNVVFLER